MAHEIRLTFPIPANADQLKAELEALNIPGVRTYSVFGSPGQCAGVYPWSDLAPQGQYLHMDEMGQTLSPGNENRIRQAISDHVYTPPPDPDEELVAAINAATNLAELKAALVGQVRKGRIKARPV